MIINNGWEIENSLIVVIGVQVLMFIILLFFSQQRHDVTALANDNIIYIPKIIPLFRKFQLFK